MKTCIVLSHAALHHHITTFTKWYQFLHVLIRTHRMSFHVLLHKEWNTAWNSDQQPKSILINRVFQQNLIDGLRTVPSTILKYGTDPSQPSDQFLASITKFFTNFSSITKFFTNFSSITLFRTSSSSITMF